jgi:hypothetical protein
MSRNNQKDISWELNLGDLYTFHGEHYQHCPKNHWTFFCLFWLTVCHFGFFSNVFQFQFSFFLLTCHFGWATSTPQQEQGEVFIPTGLQDAEVGNLEVDCAGDDCDGCRRGVGDVSSWRFYLPNVSLTTAGVAGDGCGGCCRGVGGVLSWHFLLPKVSLFLTTATTK